MFPLNLLNREEAEILQACKWAMAHAPGALRLYWTKKVLKRPLKTCRICAIFNQAGDITMNEYTIAIAFDDEAQRWYAVNDDIPLALEDDSLDTLIDRVKIAAPDVLEANNMPHVGISLAFKVEAQAVMA